MISALCWVPRGAPQVEPVTHQLTAAELDALVQEQGQLSLGGGDEAGVSSVMNGSDLAAATAAGTNEDGDESMSAIGAADEDEDDDAMNDVDDDGDDVESFMEQLNMDAYDEEGGDGVEMFLGGSRLTVYESNAEDPYITVPDDEDLSDEEDRHVLPTDSLILSCRTEAEASYMDAFVYDDANAALYTHHVIHLPAFPLCVEWLSCNPRPADETEAADEALGIGNFAALGTFEEGIEIWNMDVVDAIEPVVILGGRRELSESAKMELAQIQESIAQLQLKSKSKKKKSKKKQQGKLAKLQQRGMQLMKGDLLPGSHSDAVMCLSWHAAHARRLASGSADASVKLWDVRTQACVSTLTHHQDKVQSLQWNPSEPLILLSGAYDRSLCMVDVRTQSVQRYPLDADVECVTWNPSNPALCMASTEAGTVICYDVRNPASPLWTLGAHNDATTAVSFSPAVPNFMATASTDGSVKLWNVADGKPALLATREMQIGAIFAMKFDVSQPCTLAAGGKKGKLAVWETSTEPGVSQALAAATQQA